MSIRKNIAANYISQLYVALIGIVMVPMYVHYMGVEAYGLVGFFVMLQAWFQLLDLGLTPTMARATARFGAGGIDALNLRRLLRALEGIFLGIALIGAAVMIFCSGFIATSWLKVNQLSIDEVQHSIMLMAVIVALRWICGLYRGTINGFERMVWLGGFNILIATGRFVLVIPFFIFFGAAPKLFFSYQLVLAVIEIFVLVTKAYSLLPSISVGKKIPWEWAPLRSVLKFSLTIAFTSSVWVIVTQTDKLVLSKLLPLEDYAYFTLAVLVASGVMLLSGPISGALLPRMTKLSTSGDDIGLVELYRSATQLISVIVIPAAMVLIFFSSQVLWAWTGNIRIAEQAAPVLSLYAFGNFILALGAFPFYLQFSKGDLKLHLIGNILFIFILLPLLVWSTLNYGVLGAGYAWVITNVMYFFIWVPIVHKRLVKGLHRKWLLYDIGCPAISVFTIALLFHNLITWPQNRTLVAVMIACISLGLLLVAASASSQVRKILISRWYAKFVNKG